MSKVKILIFQLLMVISLPSFACGTANNWMDAYEGIESGNKWRDSMSSLEKLVMLRSCGGGSFINKEQQTRMLRILTDAMSNRREFSMMPTRNYDVRRQVSKYRGLIPFEGLIESTFRRFKCLPDANKKLALKIKLNYGSKTLYKYFDSYCPGGTKLLIQVDTVHAGAKLHSSPHGKVISRLKSGTKLKLLGRLDHWYRVINPVRNGHQNTMIGYIHMSNIKDITGVREFTRID